MIVILMESPGHWCLKSCIVFKLWLGLRPQAFSPLTGRVGCDREGEVGRVRNSQESSFQGMQVICGKAGVWFGKRYL